MMAMKDEPIKPKDTYTLIELLQPPKRKKFHLFDAIHAPAFFDDWRPNPFPKGGWKRTLKKAVRPHPRIDVMNGVILWGILFMITGVVLTLAFMAAGVGR